MLDSRERSGVLATPVRMVPTCRGSGPCISDALSVFPERFPGLFQVVGPRVFGAALPLSPTSFSGHGFASHPRGPTAVGGSLIRLPSVPACIFAGSRLHWPRSLTEVSIRRWIGALSPALSEGEFSRPTERFWSSGSRRGGRQPHRLRNPSNGDAPESESGSFSGSPLRFRVVLTYARGTLLDSVQFSTPAP